jgi:hypothetical protein
MAFSVSPPLQRGVGGISRKALKIPLCPPFQRGKVLWFPARQVMISQMLYKENCFRQGRMPSLSKNNYEMKNEIVQPYKHIHFTFE